MISKKLYIILLTALTLSCQTQKETTRDALEGTWRGSIMMQEKELPFHFRINTTPEGKHDVVLLNAEEKLEAGGVKWEKDSIIIPMHIFDTEIRAKVENGKMSGYWIKKYAENYVLPFSATLGDTTLFKIAGTGISSKIEGKYAVKFYGENNQEPDSINAVGIFKQNGNKLEGTFLTPTGDYRYLEGKISGNKFLLSAFDGEHAFLFEGDVINDSTLEGVFRSGKHWQEKWTAKKDKAAKLPTPNTLTFLKEGYDKLDFSFRNLDGIKISLNSPKYKDKVVIVQLFGTWCPNCMDETKFLADWYRRNKNRNIEIIGLAYEKKPDYIYARDRVKKMVEKLDVGYDFLIAGTSDKKEAAKTLPMLNHILAFPTTIFIDKQGNIRKIHTGFNGPGTGKYYEEFVEEFNLFVDKLAAE